MNDPLGGLEKKVDQIITMWEALRAENHRLRDRVVELEEQKDGLAERMAVARTRLEGLMDRLPQE